MAVLLIAAAHIGDIPENMPQKLEVEVHQDQQICHQGENGMHPGANGEKHRSRRRFANQVDEAGQSHQGNDGQ